MPDYTCSARAEIAQQEELLQGLKKTYIVGGTELIQISTVVFCISPLTYGTVSKFKKGEYRDG